jgi:hypothetical protein
MIHARSDYDRIQDPAGLIPEKEPVLLVRGQDRSAAETADFWADTEERKGGDPRLIAAARMQAERIRQWNRDVKVKAPDAPDDTF